MSDFEALRKLVTKITALEDAIQEIPVDDGVIKDDQLITKDKNLVEAMYNTVMGAGLGIPVDAKVNSNKVQNLMKNLKVLANDQAQLKTNFNNSKQFSQIKEQIADLDKYLKTL